MWKGRGLSIRLYQSPNAENLADIQTGVTTKQGLAGRMGVLDSDSSNRLLK
jgi:hypothetical protein